MTAPAGTDVHRAQRPRHAPRRPRTRSCWTPGRRRRRRRRPWCSRAAPTTTDREPDDRLARPLHHRRARHVAGDTDAVVSHGPKVIPPGETYETARYGDRPFPVVPGRSTATAPTRRPTSRDLDTVDQRPGLRRARRSTSSRRCRSASSPRRHRAVGRHRHGRLRLRAGFDFTPQSSPAQHLHRRPDATPTRPVPAVGHPGATPSGSPTASTTCPATPPTTAPTPRLGLSAHSPASARCSRSTPAAAPPASWSTTPPRSPTRRSTTPTTTPTRTASSTSSWPSSPAAAATAPPSSPSPAATTTDRAVRQRLAALLLAGVLLHRPGDRPARLHHRRPAQGPRGPAALVHRRTYARDMTTTDTGDALKVFVRVGPYNVNPETAIDKASVISHEYGHSLGLPDFYSTGSRETYGDWNLMATDKSQNMDVFSRQELGWVVPAGARARHAPDGRRLDRLQAGHRHHHLADARTARRTPSTDGRDGRVQQLRRCTSPSCPAGSCSTRRSSTPATRRQQDPRLVVGVRQRLRLRADRRATTSTCRSPSWPTCRTRAARSTLRLQVAAGTSSGTSTTATC